LNPVYIVAFCVLSVLYAWTLYTMPILAVGVRYLRRSNQKKSEAPALHAEKLPTVSIIVPVKDEEKVIGRLLKAFLNVDYPPEKREIIIVEDGSTDKTAEICEKYVGQYPSQIRLIRQSMSNGKPSALNYALKHVRGEVVAIFDADNIPESNVLLKAAKYFEDPTTAAVQGRQNFINADENMLTKFISYEEAVRYETYLRGKDVLNLFVPFTGSCYFVRRNLLNKVGGWDGKSLSEDLELSAKLVEAGYKIRYASDVRSWQENPVNLSQLFRQRTRWFRGSMEVAIKYGRLARKLNKRCIDAEITLIGPYTFIPCLIGYLITVYTLLSQVQPNAVSTIMAQFASVFTVFLLSIAGIALIYVTKPRKISNVLWLPFIYAYWIIQNFVALYALIQIVLRRPKRWVKTKNTEASINHFARV
jgi:cellulose synthase/poly-beta-1,6-N-acetylglucosamine synthase-like glycosyltransferase